MVVFIHCFAGELDSQFFEDLDIYIREHHRGMRLAAVKLRKLRESKPCILTVCGAGGQRDQNFVCVETRIFALQIVYFQFLDRLDGLRRNNVQLVVKSGKLFRRMLPEDLSFFR